MSSASVGVPPSSEADHQEKMSNNKLQAQQQNNETITRSSHQEKEEKKQGSSGEWMSSLSMVGGGGLMGSLRVIELQLVAFIMVFSASGFVPVLDLLFPAFASVYFLLLSRLAFPITRHAAGGGSRGGEKSSTSSSSSSSSLFRLYVVLGTTIGLFLPLAYALGGFAGGDQKAIRSATPHLFLLAFQILTENVITAFSLFSPPVRALVPLVYTVRRIFTDLDWVHHVWLNNNSPQPNAQLKLGHYCSDNIYNYHAAWCWFGRGLAVANLVYFSINLFGFLIPSFLPKAFETYFKERDDEHHEKHSKIAEDRQSASHNNDKSAADKKAD